MSSVGYRCLRCGVAGATCCATGTKCESGGCCSSDNRCIPDGQSCGYPTYGLCKAGKCECGAPDQVCCSTGPACTSPDYVCSGTPGSSSSICRACGQSGGACCPGNRCTTGCCVRTSYSIFSCVATAGSCGIGAGSCSATGSCGTCGGRGQPCCYYSSSYRYCSARNTTCALEGATYTCQACGGMGERCCGVTSESPGSSSGGICNGTLRCSYASGSPLSYTCQL
jgi:hypothetical protein